MSDWFRKLLGSRPSAATETPTARKGVQTLDEYVAEIPSAQNAVDLVPGWNHALPEHVAVKAGAGAFFADDRIHWGLQQHGSIAGKSILELGPLEASHTYLMHQFDPAEIVAIEANKLAFLRCLIVKELLGLTKARFLLGDFQKWLEATPQRFDLIVASGVLYHLTQPLRLLELLGAHSDALFIWTHYFDETEMPPGDLRRLPFAENFRIESFRGLDVRLHRRGYYKAWKDKKFCGGMHDDHYWLEKDHIIKVLGLMGFDDIRLADEQPDHPNGPSFSIYARRTHGAEL